MTEQATETNQTDQPHEIARCPHCGSDNIRVLMLAWVPGNREPRDMDDIQLDDQLAELYPERCNCIACGEVSTEPMYERLVEPRKWPRTHAWEGGRGSNTVVQVRDDVTPMVWLHTNMGWIPLGDQPDDFDQAVRLAEMLAKSYGLEPASYKRALYLLGIDN